jgi:hypothetical protein
LSRQKCRWATDSITTTAVLQLQCSLMRAMPQHLKHRFVLPAAVAHCWVLWGDCAGCWHRAALEVPRSGAGCTTSRAATAFLQHTRLRDSSIAAGPAAAAAARPSTPHTGALPGPVAATSDDSRWCPGQTCCPAGGARYVTRGAPNVSSCCLLLCVGQCWAVWVNHAGGGAHHAGSTPVL